MSPAKGRVWRRAQRRAWRGQRNGRRTTHPVTVTYGHRMRQQDWDAAWAGDETARERYFTTRSGTRLRAGS